MLNNKVLFSLLLPALALPTYQLLSVISLDIFRPRPSVFAYAMAVSLYIGVIFAILMAYFILAKHKRLLSVADIKTANNIFIKCLVLLLTILYVDLIVRINFHALIVGYENIRYEFFFNDEFRSSVFRSIVYDWIFNWFIEPGTVLLAIHLGFQKKYGRYFFWILILIVFYNASFGGRFSIYTAGLLIFMRMVIVSGFNRSLFLRMSILVSITIGLASLVFYFRIDDFNFKDNLLSIFEYHSMPPFYFMNKLDDDFGSKWFVDVPMASIFTALPLAIIKLFKFYSGEVPYYFFTTYFNDFSLSSDLTNATYNAFATIFPFFYVEFNLASPLVVFIYFLLLFISPLIVQKNIRLTFLCFVVYNCFFSFFQYRLVDPGTQFFIGLIFVYSIGGWISRGLIKNQRNLEGDRSV